MAEENNVRRRRRRKVEEKDYDALIQNAQETILSLEDEIKESKNQLKAEKANLKKLEKMKVAYDAMMEEKKKQQEIEVVAELITQSGRSLEEIKEFLGGEAE